MKNNIFEKLTFRAKKSLLEAEKISRFYLAPEVYPIHLLMAVYLQKGCFGSNILENLISDKVFFQEIEKFKILKKGPESSALNASRELKEIILRSFLAAKSSSSPYVGTEHLVYSLLESKLPDIEQLLARPGQAPENLKSLLKSDFTEASFPNLSKIFDLPEFPEIGAPIQTKKNGRQLLLEQYAVNISRESKKRKEIIIGRDEEINRIINILSRKTKNNPILIGEPGVGKTAAIYGLANKINSGEAPYYFLNKTIYSLDLALMVAGTSFRGEFEARLKEVVREVTKNKDIILFIDEIHSLIGAGNASGGMDAANILKPALSRGEIQCVGATTLAEYKKHLEKDAALERRFQPVIFEEPSREKTWRILSGIKSQYEEFHGVGLSSEIIDFIIETSARYIPGRYFPDKAIDVLDEAASAVKNQNSKNSQLEKISQIQNKINSLAEKKSGLILEEKYEEAIKLRNQAVQLKNEMTIARKKFEQSHLRFEITQEDVAEVIQLMTGISKDKILSEEKKGAKILAERLQAKIVGQENALRTVSESISRGASGIADPERPLDSFLFLGPSGTGKTMLSKMLSMEIFGSEKSFFKIDMSEFMEKHSLARLVGAPAGYVGYGEGGKLTEKIRRNPGCVVVFDEIEKAHPDIFNILLQILEDGSLTDAEGMSVSFKNTVLILTSNLGNEIGSGTGLLGFGSKNNNRESKELGEKFISEAKKHIRPEILGRINNIVTFNFLAQKDLEKIAKLEMEKLKLRLKKRGLTLLADSKIFPLLAKDSLDAKEGARKLRKNMEKMIEVPLAQFMLENKKCPRVKIKAAGGRILITK